MNLVKIKFEKHSTEEKKKQNNKLVVIWIHILWRNITNLNIIGILMISFFFIGIRKENNVKFKFISTL